MIDYIDLIEELNKQMPERYKDGVVKECIYERPFYRWELNFDPYKNYGQILPSEYIIRSLDDPKAILNIKKGNQYIIMVLYAISEYKDYHCLAPFFAYIFFKNMQLRKKIIRKKYRYGFRDKFEYDYLIDTSCNTLKENEYPELDYRCTYYFDYSDNVFEMIKDIDNLTVSQIASIIYETLEYNLKPNEYQLEYWHYSKAEVERANSIYSTAHEDFIKTILSDIKK